MKKILKGLLVCSLITSMLVGCSNNNSASERDKLKEELKAEVIAEMEVEQKKQEESKEQSQAEDKAKEDEKKSEDNKQPEQDIKKDEPVKEEKPIKKEEPVKKEEIKNDLSKGYTYRIDNGILKLTYKNTGNEITLAAPNKCPEDLTKWIVAISNVNKSHNGKRLYFETATWDTSNAVHYVDLETLEVKFFSDGWFKQNIGKSPYDNSVVISRTYIDGNNGRKASDFAIASTGKVICELGQDYDKNNILDVIEIAKNPEFNYNGRYNLKGLLNENINGTQVNYDEYIAVIVPMYDGLNKTELTSHSFNAGNNQNTELTFAVFGKAQNLKILHTNNAMSEEYTITNVGDIENAFVTVKTELPTDFANVTITCGVMAGEGNYEKIEFSLDDMRAVSEYKPVMIKY